MDGGRWGWKYNKYNSWMSLKDFVIVAKLGEGAYSSVYKVQRIVDSQIYALKKVKMNNLSDKEQENALNEVRILASLNSPYIVGYKHSFIEANSLWYPFPHAASSWSSSMTAISIRKSWRTRRRGQPLRKRLFGVPSSK
jgi:serine/threonine protein kinase